MSGPSTILGILNHADAPHQDMVVAVFGAADARRWAYINPKNGFVGRYRLHRPEEVTALSDFGIRARMTADSQLQLTRHTISIATYRDGKPRPWQGADDVIVFVRESMIGKVGRAVRLEFQARQKARQAECRTKPANSPETMMARAEEQNSALS
jgi:hypothetical protein